MRRLLLPCLLLPACGDPIRDDWGGACKLGAEGREVRVDLTFESVGISRKKDGRTMWATEAFQEDSDLAWAGDFIGAGEGAYDLVLTASPEDATSTFHLEAELLLDGKSIEGPGSYWVETEDDVSLTFTGTCDFGAPKGG